MSSRAVVIAHREAMVAEGIAAALGRFPELVPVAAVTSGAEAARYGERADAVALDAALPDAASVAASLRRAGVRVVFLGDNGDHGGDDASDDVGVRISTRAPVSSLASALVPGVSERRGTSGLTAREREILGLVARGLVGKQVARHLGISPKTVERHKTRIFAKLGVPNQTAAVSLAARGEREGRLEWD